MLFFLISQFSETTNLTMSMELYIPGTGDLAWWKEKQYRNVIFQKKRPLRCQPEIVKHWDQAEKAAFWKTFEESIFIIIAIFIYCQRYRENEVTIDKKHKIAISCVSKWLSKAFLNKSGRWCTYSLSTALRSQAGKDKWHITEKAM